MPTITGTIGNDNLNGGNGDDVIWAGAGADVLSGGSGNDTMNGEAGADRLVGGSGNDELDGGSGSDSVSGDAGNDTLVYRLYDNLGAADVYTGGAGTDTLVLQLTAAQWQDPSVRAVLQGYVEHLSRVARSGQGEVSNGGASDYTLDFGGGTRLTVQMTEKLAVGVQAVASGAYVLVDHTAALIAGVAAGSTKEASGVANGTPGTATAAGDLSSDDLDGPDDLFQAVVTAQVSDHGYGSFTVTSAGVWTFTLNDAHPSVQELNAGGTLVETFKVMAADGTPKVVSVTIAGANDAAVIVGQSTGSVTEAGGVANGSTGTPGVSGNLYADDVDNPDDTFQPVAAGAATASGLGSYAVTATGQWTFTLNNASPAVQALNVNDTLSDSFTVKSQDGTSQVVTVTIAGSNDAAVITGSASGTVVEAGAAGNGTPTASGDLFADDVDNPDDLFVAVAAGAGTALGYGSYAVDATGKWTYTLDNAHAAVQALNGGASLSDSFTVSTVDGTLKVVNVTIDGRNDAAQITGQSTGEVIEAGSAGVPGVATASGNLFAADVDNPADTFQAVPAGAATVNGHGTYGVDAAGKWTYSLDNSKTAVQALNEGGTLTDRFTVRSQDGTEQVVTLTITGTNDAAVITGPSTGNVVEAGGVGNASVGTPAVSGDLLATDVDNAPDVFQAVPSAVSAAGYGSYSVDATGHWSYTLDNGNATVQALNVDSPALMDSFTVLSEDGTAQIVTIQIAGRNDAATITGQDTGSVTEAGGVANGSGGTHSVSGQLFSSDIDDVDTFQAKAAGSATAMGYGTFGVSIDGQWTFTLDDENDAVQALKPGQQLTDSFVVNSHDGTAQTVTVAIDGSNDAAVISGDAAGAVKEAGVSGAGTATTSGDLDAIDVDDDDTFVEVPAPTATASGYGHYSVDVTGHWSYTLDNGNAAVQALNDTHSLLDSFLVHSADGTSQLVTITISGSNDAAVITGPGTGPVVESGSTIAAVISGSSTATVVETVDGGDPSAEGDLYADDVDNADDVFQVVAAGAQTVNGYGTFAVAANGEWTFTLDNDHPAVQALNQGDELVDTFTVRSQDGTAKVVTITIGGRNDAATISGPSTGDLVEAGGVANGTAGTAVAAGDLTAVDVDDQDDRFVAIAAGAQTLGGYGSFGIDMHGGWTYTLDDAQAAVQGLNENESLSDSFVVASIDGTAHVVNVNIAGRNDAAVIDGKADGGVTEAGGASNGTAGSAIATGNLFAQDVDNPDDVFQAVAPGAASDHHLGSYGIDAAGKWTYRLDDTNAAVQGLNDGQTLQDSFTVRSIDGTAQVVVITIAGANDNAVISGTATGSVIEAGGLANGIANTPTADGDLLAVDVDDPLDLFQAVAAGHATASGYGTWGVDTAGHWVFTLNNGHAAVQALNENQTLSDSFTVSSADGTQQVVTVTIVGRNDTAIITGQATGTVVEGGGIGNAGGTPMANGNLYADDVDNTDDKFMAVAPGAGTTNGYGTYGIDTAGKWTYLLNEVHAAVQALNVGSTLTDSFTVQSLDGTPQTVTITIDGRNDAATISGTTSGSLIEAGGLDNGSAGTATASGDLLAVDVDDAADAFQAVADGALTASGYGRYGVDAAGRWTYVLDDTHPTVQALNGTQSLIDSFTVRSADGTAQLVTVSIAGRNDVAVISGDVAGAVVEAGGVSNGQPGMPSFTGDLHAEDVDNPDDVFQAVSAGAATVNGYGTYGVEASGKWTYALNNAHAAVQALNVGQTLTDSFTVLSADGTAQVVTITINGSNDAATISGGVSGSVVEAGGMANGTAGTAGANGDLLATDVDNPSDSFVAAGTPTAAFSGYGQYTVAANGQWTYLLNDDDPSVQALNATDTLTDTFTVMTIDGTASDVTITINGRNDAPTGQATATLPMGQEDVPCVVSASSLVAGFTDVDDAVLSVANLSASSGTAVANGDGTFTITPAANFNGTVTLSYSVIDGHGGSVAASQSITLAAVNDAPAGAPTALLPAGTEDIAYSFSAASLMAGFIDVDGDTLAVSNVTASNGTVVQNVGGTFTVTPTANFNGLVTLNYEVVDGHGGITPASQSYSLAPVNDAAVIGTPTVATVTEDLAVNGSGNLTAVGTISVTDVDVGEASFQTLVTSGAGNLGSLVIASNGSYTYAVSNASVQSLGTGQTKVDSFTVRSLDGTQKTVAFTINGADEPIVNRAPVIASNGGGNSASISVFENSTQVTTVSATDPDADALTYSIVGGADQSKFTINATTGVLAFAAAPNFEVPTDQGGNNVYDVIVRASDGSLFDEQAIAVSVGNNNDAPSGTNNTLTIVEDQAYTFKLTDFGFTDVGESSPNSLLAVKITTLPNGANGVMLLNNAAISAGTMVGIADISAGKLTFVPTDDYSGTAASFTFQVQDNGGTANGGTDLDASANLMSFIINAAADVLNDKTNGQPANNGYSIAIDSGNLSIADAGGTDTLAETSNVTFSTFKFERFSDNLEFTGTSGVNSVHVTLLSQYSGTTNVETMSFSSGGTVAGYSLGTAAYSLATSTSGGSGNDIVAGSSADDVLNGGSGNDLLFGSAGNDRLVGGAGNDLLAGGAGADTLAFNAALNGSTNVDTIMALEADSDKIELSAAVFSAAAFTNGVLNGNNFRAMPNVDANNQNHHILFDTSNGNLYYDADGSGAGAKVLFAHIDLVGMTGSVDATDFILGT